MQSLGLSKYNMQSLGAPTAEAATIHGNAIVTPAGVTRRLDPDSPVLWIVGLGAVTLGLVAVSTHVKVGPLTASASI